MPRRYAEAAADFHQIHLDPAAAAKAGLPGVILHGLCTLALCSKPFIERLSAGDPRCLKRLHARFVRPVFPGQPIDIKVWAAGERAGRQVYDFEVTNPDKQVVIRNGIAEISLLEASAQSDGCPMQTARPVVRRGMSRADVLAENAALMISTPTR